MRKIVLGMALASTALATPAQARDDAWYVELDFGPMIAEDADFEIGVWGKNLLDKRYMVGIGGYAATELGVPHGRINRGLEAGVDFKYSF